MNVFAKMPNQVLLFVVLMIVLLCTVCFVLHLTGSLRLSGGTNSTLNIASVH